jgi:hypothetical protein
MTDDDLAVFAVLGDPAGNRYIQAPPTQAEMHVIKTDAETRGELFFCSSRLGGCGQRVMVINGPERRPHFRHYARTDCPLTRATARDIYTHAMIQAALVGWLHNHGHPDAVTEKRLDKRSRVDVHCEPGAVIEVQLSGETDSSMRCRTSRYGGNVTWLYDPHNAISSRDSALARDSIVLLVRLRPAGGRTIREPQTGFSQQPIDIGLSFRLGDTDGGYTDWWPLEECTFSPAEGLRPPGYAAAKQDVIDARRLRQERAEAEQRSVDKALAERQEVLREIAASERARQAKFMQDLAVRRGKSEQETAARRARNLADRGGVPGLGTRQGWHPVVYTLQDLAIWEAQHQMEAPVHGAWRRVLEYHDGPYADWVALMTDGWATGLPEHLIDPAWAALYQTGTSMSGQVSVFLGGGDLDVDPLRPYDPIDPQGLILARFVALGLVTLHGGPPDPLMIHVGHRLGQLRWNSNVLQPATWTVTQEPAH